MNDERVVETSMWVMILAQTVGAVDLPGYGDRKLPSPSQYVAIIALWSLLGVGTSIGGAVSRLSARLAILVTIAAMVLGPFGKRLTGLLTNIGKLYATAPQPQTATLLYPAQGTPGGTRTNTTEA
jgi:hypothetical protein